jgi:tetratricopeptide (TPR) repeat protein
MGLARAEQGAERFDATRAAIANAQRLAPKATPREQAFIALRARQIEAQDATGPDQSQKFDAYKEAIDAALASYPDDAELWILRGNAEEPGPWGRGQFGGAASIAFYETALVRSPGHLGAHHYLVHSFENIAHPAEAAAHGRIYADSAPGVAHAQHMLGHVLPRLGRWEEALVQFQKADAIEEDYARRLNLRPGDDWHHLHNLQLLGYTYLRLGRAAEAEATFRRAFDTPARLPYRGSPQASLAEFYLLRGRLDDALAVARALQTPTRTPATHAVAAVVEGETLLAMGKLEASRACAARAKQTLEDGDRELPRFQARYLDIFVRPYVEQLDTEIALRGESPAAAEASILAVADALSANPRFDAWGEGLFRLQRIAVDARRAGRTQLAADIETRMRKIDPDYVPEAAPRQALVR